MKIYSPLGKMTGKLGNIVVSSVAGDVIGREYNPNVTNPNTQGQQTTRAKFKLGSQLAMAVAPVIAIKKVGRVSARNQFIKVNFDSIRYATGVADINLNVVQLTKSNIAFAGFNADRSSGTAIAVELNESAAAALSRVVYIAYKKAADGSLLLLDSKTCNTAGADGKFADSLAYSADAVVLYAYGMKDLNSGITTKFGNMSAPSAEDVAQLLVSNTENMNSVQLTKTAGLTMAAGEDTGDSDDVEHLTVSLVISGNGSATGGGRFEAGQTVTLRATPDAEASFVAWKANNASGQVLSTANPFQFAIEQNMTVCAVFQGGPTPTYGITVSADPANGGTVTGGGNKSEGESCTVVATPAEGKVFSGWYENNALVSGSASYTFTVQSNRNLVARFADAPEGVILSARTDQGPWNRSGSYDDSTEVIGTFDASANGKVAAMVQSTDQPTVGSTQTVKVSQTIADGAATINIGSCDQNVHYWLVVGTVNGSTITVEDCYQYWINVWFNPD